ncbi:fluoride efflux transporter FluC [Corynebacterium occultum]|uniref:fluoride efflux transporter FluC n=1 Tax=Corynebacterium occultum TaxID=2675219 RepID=UPI0018CE7167|nr:CrcB family protein [Corynebacterium occultum]
MSDINHHPRQEPDSARVGGSGSAQRKDRSPRPTYRQTRYVVVVFVGGVFGTLARYGLDSILPTPGGWPLPTLLINIGGAFMLGVILEAVVRHNPGGNRSVMIGLSAGTGFMGAVRPVFPPSLIRC